MSAQPEDKKGQDDPEELSRAWDWHVRRKVAWSADTPEKILDTLSPGQGAMGEGSSSRQLESIAAGTGPAGRGQLRIRAVGGGFEQPRHKRDFGDAGGR